MKTLFTAIGRLLRHPLFWIAVLTVVAARWAVGAITPKITYVPIVTSSELVIEGHGFGNQTGAVTLTDGTPLTVRSWTNKRITTEPPQATSGGFNVQRPWLFGVLPAHGAFVVQASSLPSAPWGYEVPVQPDSPWPMFRRDHRNTAHSPIHAAYAGDQPWAFATGKGIFSTPVIDADGVIYVGSADHIFYAINPDGTERWRYETGEIIDSAAALPRVAPGTAQNIYLPSGDGLIYNLSTAAGLPRDERLLWSFDSRIAERDSYNNWFEGNIAIAPNGDLYAGNTNFNYYAINPDGELDWVYETGSNNWSIAAIGDDGTIYWGSNDTFIRAVAPDGTEKWLTRTLGFIAASAAIGSDGTVYIGSFDSYLYALNPVDGSVRWRFKTNDHIYASVALDQDSSGNTSGIYLASTDGSLYALRPDGSLRWAYDTGDPIRSSPVIGQKPEGEQGGIVYFGNGGGKLFALDTFTGERRWSFDTTASNAELGDRNDLNGSPALGHTGIVIGGEHGQVWYVPYDYCLHNTDNRCTTDPGSDLPDNVAGWFYVTPGGNTLLNMPDTLTTDAMISLRLLVRDQGHTVDAAVCNLPVGCPDNSLEVRLDPPAPLVVEKSADGHYLHIIPQDFLQPNTDYTLTVDGDYYTGGLALGNLDLGGSRAGTFADTFTFRTAPLTADAPPLTISGDAVSAIEWTRLAVPIPPMMPSLNQIGFDYMDWIIGTVQISDPDAGGEGSVVLWAVGGRYNEAGVLVADPNTDFTLPLSGRYQGDNLILTNRDFVMPITGIPIPFNLFELRGSLGPDGHIRPGATAYADTEALSIPTFGPYLVVAGLANNIAEKLIVAGTYVTRPYEGPANQRPEGIAVEAVTFVAPTADADGYVEATFALDEGASYPLADHRPGILLIDPAAEGAVFLNYHANLSSDADADGNLRATRLVLPAGLALPDDTEAIIMLDVFPFHREPLE